jgi:uncharacterized protein (DUF608 family)
MADSNKVNRRTFIADGTGALVGAAALSAAADQLEAAGTEPAQPSRFLSPAANEIPFSRAELMATGTPRTFEGAALSEIAFPLGGIGTGTVSLGGRGDLRDWEIFNRPNKGHALPFSFVALWVKASGATPVMKVVEAPPGPPFRGASGYARERAQGLPHLRSAGFTGTYPIAHIAFDDDTIPVKVTLEAFNPFLPLESDDSAIPVAILRYRLTNRSKAPVDVALAFSIMNAIGYDGVSAISGTRFPGFGQNLTRLRREDGLSGLELTSAKYKPDDVRGGSMAVVTSHPDVTARCAWEVGAWWDSFQKWFDEFATAGRVADRMPMQPTADTLTNYATLAPYGSLKPGESRAVEFFLTWYFPVRENYWNRNAPVFGEKLRNHYASLFKDAWDVARYTAANLPRLERVTRSFRDQLFASTVPSVILDAVSSQMSIIRTNTCMLLEGRRFFAFEGTNDTSGCCPLNCTHVWNYEQALAYLFPDLERSMRLTDFEVNVRDDGAMVFRTFVPTGRALWDYRPAADGQMGCILKLYREWQISGDDAFLRRLWPTARRTLEYAWVLWDADRDGVMEGQQHNTYDIEFYGPNTMMGTLYLGALLAGERMARAMGDEASARQYRAVFESGRQKLDAQLWQRDYYIQRVPASATAPAHAGSAWVAPEVDAGAFKYQYGDGCLSDQLLGQWFAEVVNLGHLLPADHVRGALQSIYRYNFKSTFLNHPNTQRIYALNDEKGLLLCSWPQGKRPALPFVYSDEVWTGIEYQVAAHLIYERFVEEGLAIVKGVRDRYDGRRRNPWNEVECGSHYARALASWSLLTACGGYRYSAPERHLGFAPRVASAAFATLFTTGQGWGTFAQHTLTGGAFAASVSVSQGRLTLASLGLGTAPPLGRARATIGSGTIAVRYADHVARFDPPVVLEAGDILKTTVEPMPAPESDAR